MIDRIWEREFGFVFSHNGKKYMRRKLCFENESELWAFIQAREPLDCYISTAFYDYPSELKGWKGAELFFDFDSESLKKAYTDALTTYEVLLDDFGLKAVQMNFSGARGYHVIVHDEDPRKLKKDVGDYIDPRQEIIDYLRLKYRVETLDAAATKDIKRLRRLEGTRNSKTGKFCRAVKTSFK